MFPTQAMLQVRTSARRTSTKRDGEEANGVGVLSLERRSCSGSVVFSRPLTLSAPRSSCSPVTQTPFMSAGCAGRSCSSQEPSSISTKCWPFRPHIIRLLPTWHFGFFFKRIFCFNRMNQTGNEWESLFWFICFQCSFPCVRMCVHLGLRIPRTELLSCHVTTQAAAPARACISMQKFPNKNKPVNLAGRLCGGAPGGAPVACCSFHLCGEGVPNPLLREGSCALESLLRPAGGGHPARAPSQSCPPPAFLFLSYVGRKCPFGEKSPHPAASYSLLIWLM